MRYYSEYVNHMLRFYARFPEISAFKNKTDKENWITVKTILDNLSDAERNVIIEVYKRRDTLSDNVYELSKELGINQDIIWTILNKVTRKIAKERELI